MNALWTSRSWRFLPLLAICCVFAGSLSSAHALLPPILYQPPPPPPPPPPPLPQTIITPPPSDGGSPGSGTIANVPPPTTNGTPEPGSLVLALAGSGTALLTWLHRRRRSIAASATA